MPNEFDFMHQDVPRARAYFAGDLLFFYGRDLTSRIIEIGTRGPSHVGMIFTYRDEPMLVESTMLCDLPCAIKGEKISGVQAHRPTDRIRSYRGKVFHAPIRWGCHFRKSQSRELTEQIYEEYLGEPYDLRGAIGSPTPFPLFTRPDLGSLFCSALCGLLLMDFAKLNRENPKRITPAGLLKRVLTQATHLPPVPVTSIERN